MPKFYTRRNSNRIPRYDYSTPGQYFITICTENRQQLFGMIENNQMMLNDAGVMIDIVLKQIPANYRGSQIDEYVVMPNHSHVIINIVGVDPRGDPIQNDNFPDNHNGQTQGSAPTVLSLSNIIQRFKTLTTKKYIDGVKNNHWPVFTKRLWQRNFYDHIIRNDKSLDNIRQYIYNNPLTWDSDTENPSFMKKVKLKNIDTHLQEEVKDKEFRKIYNIERAKVVQTKTVAESKQ